MTMPLEKAIEADPVAPVRSNILRSLINDCLSLSPEEGEKIRLSVRDDDVTPDQYRTGRPAFNYAMVRMTENMPWKLAAGFLAWLYVLVYVFLKLTILN